jgi:hypothetical protein
MTDPLTVADAALAYCRARRALLRAHHNLTNAEGANWYVSARIARARVAFEEAAQAAGSAWEVYLAKDESDE